MRRNDLPHLVSKPWGFDYCTAMCGLGGMTSLVDNPGQKNILKIPVVHMYLQYCAAGTWEVISNTTYRRTPSTVE